VIEPHDEIRPQLDLESQSLAGDVRVLVLTGELDVATVGGFEAALAEALKADVRACVADLTQLTFIDSTGLAALLVALRQLERAGARLLVACANPTVLRLFEVTKTDETLEVFPTRERALEVLDGRDGTGAAA
jgi:anti-sigma B factor antagonist